ncbi:MAG: type II toxin-antitoxin system VapC family toxin [Polyangiales bacterium]
MKQLLDTHTLLWFFQDDPRLSATAATAIEAESAHNHVSLATLWEISIKVSLGKLRVSYGPGKARQLPDLLQHNGIALLSIAAAHCDHLSRLPFHHRDPFDRMLVAQSHLEDLRLISRDAAFDAYGVQRIW